MDAPAIVFIGAGGHARVAYDALRASGDSRSVGFLDGDTSLTGTTIAGAPVLGDDDLLPQLLQQGTQYFVVGVGSVGNNARRAAIFERALTLGLRPLQIVHPKATVSPSARLGAGAQVFAGAIINPDASVGVNAIVNTGAIVEHDCLIDDHAHVATGAVLAGNVIVDTMAHVGAGATIRQGIKIHRCAIVGAGAVVVKDVPQNTTVVGVPAREREVR